MLLFLPWRAPDRTPNDSSFAAMAAVSFSGHISTITGRPGSPARLRCYDSKGMTSSISDNASRRPRMPRFEEKAGTYFITFSLKRRLMQLSPLERQEVYNIIRQGHGLRYDLYALVVMPDHVHIILHAIAEESPVSLPTIMHHIKGFSAFKINKLSDAKALCGRPATTANFLGARRNSPRW